MDGWEVADGEVVGLGGVFLWEDFFSVLFLFFSRHATVLGLGFDLPIIQWLSSRFGSPTDVVLACFDWLY